MSVCSTAILCERATESSPHVQPTSVCTESSLFCPGRLRPGRLKADNSSARASSVLINGADEDSATELATGYSILAAPPIPIVDSTRQHPIAVENHRFLI